jgi:hypothetical protein
MVSPFILTSSLVISKPEVSQQKAWAESDDVGNNFYFDNGAVIGWIYPSQ